MRVGNTEPYLCTAVTAIDKCDTYDGTVATSTCVSC